MREDVIIIGGPTGVGKSGIGIKLAKKTGGEIVSADSMQIYRGMDIGTGKIKEEERQGVPHHLLSFVEPDEEYTVANYREDAKSAIRDIIARGKVPIVVGGTGLYIQSLLYILHRFGIPPHPDFRKEMEKVAEDKGTEELYRRLKVLNPSKAESTDPHNKVRLIRALEIETFGESGKKPTRERDDEFNYILYGLTMDRQKLYDRINRRVDRMLDEGLISEVEGLLEKGYTKDMMSMKAIGYKEVIAFLEGNWSREYMVEKLKQYSRNYAKRQLTWFRRYDSLVWLNRDEYTDEEITEIMETRLKK